jgi:hypothetical protein
VAITVGYRSSWTFNYTDTDTLTQDLTFHVLNQPLFGNVSVQGNRLTYSAGMVGNETLLWYVSDDVFQSNTVAFRITIVPPPDPAIVPAPSGGENFLTTGTFYGIIIGGGALFVVLGILLFVFLYRYFIAARFQQLWEKEFRENRLQANPLYQAVATERVNPLYDADAGTDTMTKNSSSMI